MSQRRHEVATLAGLQAAPVAERSQPAAHATVEVTQSRSLWSDDSDLTELSEDSASDAQSVAGGDTKAIIQPGVASQGSIRLGDNIESSQHPPASLQTHHEINTPTQTFRKTGRHKRGRSADESDGKESSDEDLARNKGGVPHQNLPRHSSPRQKTRGNTKRKKPSASTSARPKSIEAARGGPGTEALSGSSQVAKTFSRGTEDDVSFDDFLPPAPSPPPPRSSIRRDHQKKSKKATAEWMSSANVKLVERRMQSSEALAAASIANENPTASSDGVKSKQIKQERRLASGSAERPGQGLCIIGAAKGGQASSRTASFQSSTAHCLEGRGGEDGDADNEQHDLLDFQVDANEEDASLMIESHSSSALQDADHRYSRNMIDGPTVKPPPSPTSPSQVALERQQSRHAVPKDYGPAYSAPAPPADVPSSAPVDVKRQTGRGFSAATKPGEGVSEVAESSRASTGRHSQLLSKEDQDVCQGSDEETEADKAAQPQALTGNRGTTDEVSATTPATCGDATKSSVGRQPKGTRQVSPDEIAIASKAPKTSARKPLVASRLGANLETNKAPSPKLGSGHEQLQGRAFSAEPPSDLISDEGLKLKLSRKSSDKVFTGGNDSMSLSGGPMDRDELEQHLVKGMNDIRAVYKALAKSGFSDDIDDFEDPACDQKSKSVLALESAARTTLKLGQYLYDLATKKDECERRERDEINRRKISDKVDVMSERLQGVLNEAGDVIQVLQSVDAWVNRHERGDAGRK